MNPIMPLVAGGAIAAYRIVKVGAAVGQGLQAAANTDVLLGVASMVGVAEDQVCDVRALGPGEVELGGAVAYGDLITSDANGKGVELTDAMLATGAINSIGVAMSAGASGDICPIFILPQKVSKFDTVTSSAAELNILDGATLSTAELNILDGVTATAAELNILDGVTATAAELNILDGVTATMAELNILDGVTADAAELNILDGVTATAAELNILDGVTATMAELNILDGVTADAAELNILDGVTSTAAELNILDGVTATAAELNTLDGGPAAATITVGAENGGTGEIIVGIQLKDANGADLAVRGSVMAYLSDDANGDSVIAAAHSGDVVAGTDGLAIPLVAKKCFLLTSESDGDIDFSIIEAGAKTAYLILVMPNGKLVASAAITHA